MLLSDYPRSNSRRPLASGLAANRPGGGRGAVGHRIKNYRGWPGQAAPLDPRAPADSVRSGRRHVLASGEVKDGGPGLGLRAATSGSPLASAPDQSDPVAACRDSSIRPSAHWEIGFDQLAKISGFWLYLPAPRGAWITLGHCMPGTALNLAARSDEQKLMLLAEPVVGAEVGLGPDDLAFVLESPRLHHLMRVQLHRRGRPEEQTQFLAAMVSIGRALMTSVKEVLKWLAAPRLKPVSRL